MKNRIFTIASWLIVAWAAKVFLFSLPYKFSGHPDTVHIFTTIGVWIRDTINNGLGDWFIHYGAYAVGSAELITSIVLLSPLLILLLQKMGGKANLPSRSFIHALGGLMATGIMSGAAFFHLITPLGIEVLHEGKSDHGSLFFAAVSILILGLVLFAMNFSMWKASKKQEKLGQLA